MKKTSIIVTTCCLLVCLCFNNLGILSYADTEVQKDVMNPETHYSLLGELLSPNTGYASNITEYNNFMTSYFDNLTYNIGINYKGSCGYVAMAMLLSYYDTFLNDVIIPEQYDVASDGNNADIISRRNSPGVLRDVIVNANDESDVDLESMSATDYYLHMNSISNLSLHAKLITIGASYGYYDYNNESDSFPAGTRFDERVNIVNNYLQNVACLDASNYTLRHINHEDNASNSDLVREFVVQSILAGHPVLLGVRGVGGTHAVVAYDCEYNEFTDEFDIYCHMGYGANRTHVTPESQGFSIYRSALVIDFDLDHGHSNNYGITTFSNNIPDTKYYCYSDCTIIPYNEFPNGMEHNTSNHLYSSTEHISKCTCEYIAVTYPHRFTYSYFSPTQHRKSCSDCSHFGSEDHTYIPQPSNSAAGHQRKCVCGQYASDQAHYKSYCGPKDNDLHYVYCECGYLVETDTHNMVGSLRPGVSACKDCGYLRDNSNPGIIIKRTEDEIESLVE